MAALRCCREIGENRIGRARTHRAPGRLPGPFRRAGAPAPGRAARPGRQPCMLPAQLGACTPPIGKMLPMAPAGSVSMLRWLKRVCIGVRRVSCRDGALSGRERRFPERVGQAPSGRQQKIQAGGQHTFSFLPGSPATMEPHQADRSVLDALELRITGLRPCWRGVDVAAAAGRPELAEAIPQFNPDCLALLSKVDAGQRQATVEFSFAAGGRPASAVHQARGWWAATMVAFVMAAFCCACDDGFIPMADGLLDACGTCRAASVLSGSTRRCGEKVHIHLHNSDDLGTGHYRVCFGVLVPDGGAATLPPGVGGGTGAPVAGLADNQPS
jgi:hypothetical protein